MRFPKSFRWGTQWICGCLNREMYGTRRGRRWREVIMNTELPGAKADKLSSSIFRIDYFKSTDSLSHLWTMWSCLMSLTFLSARFSFNHTCQTLAASWLWARKWLLSKPWVSSRPHNNSLTYSNTATQLYEDFFHNCIETVGVALRVLDATVKEELLKNS